MQQDSRIELATLGEFKLIEHLTQDIQLQQKSTVLGSGDDAAIIQSSRNEQILLTTDLLAEGIHFNLTYVPLKHLGYKAVMVNLSDIYAMNATPTQIVVALAISKKFSLQDVEELFSGMLLACRQHNVDLVGGDTTSSLTGLTISISCIGTASPEQIVKRSGAQNTDLICVSGNLGAAYMGLQLLEREQAVFLQQTAEAKTKGNKSVSPTAQPDFAGYEYLLQRQLSPEARRDIITALSQANILPTSMIDISDGLSSELLHICTQSHVGCRIYEQRLPIDYQTALAAEQFNISVTTAALNGGEDYELLFTIPLTQHDAVSQIPDVKVIGHITQLELGYTLVCRDHSEIPIKAQGWTHLQ